MVVRILNYGAIGIIETEGQERHFKVSEVPYLLEERDPGPDLFA